MASYRAIVSLTWVERFLERRARRWTLIVLEQCVTQNTRVLCYRCIIHTISLMKKIVVFKKCLMPFHSNHLFSCFFSETNFQNFPVLDKHNAEFWMKRLLKFQLLTTGLNFYHVPSSKAEVGKLVQYKSHWQKPKNTVPASRKISV